MSGDLWKLGLTADETTAARYIASQTGMDLVEAGRLVLRQRPPVPSTRFVVIETSRRFGRSAVQAAHARIEKDRSRAAKKAARATRKVQP